MEIAVYIEGGGNTTSQKAELRQGFDALFAQEKSKAGEKRGSLKFVCCGGRQEAYDAFQYALKANSERINALLVDSETSIASVPKIETQDALVRVAHLRQKQGTAARGQGDGWTFSGDVVKPVHLMVQCMEAWIVADPDALEKFYGPKFFNKNKLPKRLNLEEESKTDIYANLEKETKSSQKGEYGKIRHAGKLLATIDPEKVADRCPRFKIFRRWLVESIDDQPAVALLT